jgi:hypothetical protein
VILFQDHHLDFPILLLMARDYLACSATSASVKRRFSAAANICAEDCRSLAPRTIERCVNSWVLALFCLGSKAMINWIYHWLGPDTSMGLRSWKGWLRQPLHIYIIYIYIWYIYINIRIYTHKIWSEMANSGQKLVIFKKKKQFLTGFCQLYIYIYICITLTS